MLIVVATIGTQNGQEIGAPEVIARGFGGDGELLDEAREEAERILRACLTERIERAQAAAGAPARRRSAGSSTSARAGGR